MLRHRLEEDFFPELEVAEWRCGLGQRRLSRPGPKSKPVGKVLMYTIRFKKYVIDFPVYDILDVKCVDKSLTSFF